MPKFIFLYRGEPTDMSTRSPEQVQEEMDRWGAWMGKVGSALVDGGAPFGAGTSVVDDGTETSAVGLTGYTIVETDDLAAAIALTDGHPFLRDGNGDYAVDLFELVDMDGL
jgi:hypothetical protein